MIVIRTDIDCSKCNLSWKLIKHCIVNYFGAEYCVKKVDPKMVYLGVDER